MVGKLVLGISSNGLGANSSDCYFSRLFMPNGYNGNSLLEYFKWPPKFLI